MLLRWEEPKQEVSFRKRTSTFSHFYYFCYHYSVKTTDLLNLGLFLTYACSLLTIITCRQYTKNKTVDDLRFLLAQNSTVISFFPLLYWVTRAWRQLEIDVVKSCSSISISKPLCTQKCLLQGKGGVGWVGFYSLEYADLTWDLLQDYFLCINTILLFWNLTLQ